VTPGAGTVLAIPIVLAGGYAVLATADRARRAWSRWRLTSFVLGSVLVEWALSPSFDAYADRDFAGHMAQHLLLAMVAPVGLVLGAPVTLLLRSLPVRRARTLTRGLRCRPAHLLANPWVALLLSTGGLVAFYFTPLYGASTRHEWLHAAIHLHFLASGCLFAWVVAGPDPAPSRPTVRLRLVVLGVAVAVHASAAQLLYAGLLVQVHEPVAQMQAAGDLMYFGGDVAELLLALALLSSWRPRRFRSAVIG
jgi:putative membrane protein